jgi:hypothetical protein
MTYDDDTGIRVMNEYERGRRDGVLAREFLAVEVMNQTAVVESQNEMLRVRCRLYEVAIAVLSALLIINFILYALS